MDLFAIVALVLAAVAYYRIDKLEKELKKTKLLDQNFKSEGM